MTREAELELEIARLREAFEQVANSLVNVEHALKQEKRYVRAADASRATETIRDILSTQPSTTALQFLIEKVERRTIERCAEVSDELRHPYGYSGENADWCEGTKHCAEAIRALPTGNLKLEDLK